MAIHLMQPVVLTSADPHYPAALIRTLGKHEPASVTALGNLDLLDLDLLALFCSVKCPGNLILQLYDFARALRDQNVPVIGGFHTLMERECLRILLRGAQPIVIVLARNLSPRQILPEWRAALAVNRLLVLSPFDTKHSRVTGQNSAYRNRVAAALASRVFIGYAAPNGKTEALAREIALTSKPLGTFDAPANKNLIEIGAVCDFPEIV